jgi:hypothetical protein
MPRKGSRNSPDESGRGKTTIGAFYGLRGCNTIFDGSGTIKAHIMTHLKNKSLMKPWLWPLPWQGSHSWVARPLLEGTIGGVPRMVELEGPFYGRKVPHPQPGSIELR